MTTNRSKFLFRLPMLFALALIAAGCQTPPSVISDTAPGAKVDAYRTFGFLEKSGTDAQGYTTLTTQHLKDAVTREMVARGYEFSKEPELLVDFEVGAKGAPKKSGGGVSVGAGGSSGGGKAAGVGINLGNLFSGSGAESIVRLDVIDAAQKQVVWNGTVTQRVPAGQELSKEAIDQAVATVFTKYPKPVAAEMQKAETPPKN